MSEVTYKKIVDVEQIDTLGEGTTLFVNDGGSMKQMGAAALGAVKSVNGVLPDENGDLTVVEPQTFVFTNIDGDVDCPYEVSELIKFATNASAYKSVRFVHRVRDLFNPSVPIRDYVWTGASIPATGTGVFQINFGDEIAPILINSNANTITLDPDWVAPEADPEPTGAHQMLVTGADGSTKWEDRTHWAESSEVMVVDETTITGSPGQFFVVSALKDDGEYTVLYNGVEYECVPKTDPSGDLALGNLKLAKSTLEDTGEPFLFTGMSTAGVTSYAFFADKTGTSTFSVSGQEIAVHTLDPKYLPEDHINGLIDSKLEGAGSGGLFVVNVIGTGDGYNNTYTSDKTYEEIRAAYDKGLPVVANAKIPMSGNQYCCTLLPLDLSEDSFEYDEMRFGGYESNFNKCVLITICKNGDIYDQINTYTLPIPLLADGTMMVVKNKKWAKVDAPVVYSPSGKCFKLTVNDSGTITATEVTE